MSDFNTSVIEEFRANSGKLGGYFDGKLMALLTTTGAKSGQPRLIPLMYFPDGERVFIVASKGGAPTHPDWYHNLVENPEGLVEIADDRYPVRARILTEPERTERYGRVVEVVPSFGEYVEKTTRVIPIVELIRLPETGNGSSPNGSLNGGSAAD